MMNTVWGTNSNEMTSRKKIINTSSWLGINHQEIPTGPW
jgi:hypothetical protein